MEPEKKKPSELTPEDYEKALEKLGELKAKLEELEILTVPINSARINDAVDKLQHMLEEELYHVSHRAR